MSKYVKNVWKDRIVEHPNRYEDQNGNTLTLTQKPGNIVQEGTLVDAEKMNHIEEGIEALDDAISKMPTDLSEYAKTTDLPTKLSQLENDLLLKAESEEELITLSQQNPDKFVYTVQEES